MLPLTRRRRRRPGPSTTSPSSSLRHRSASAAPKPQSQDSRHESDDDDEDMQLGGDVIEIPKPAGEVGRPNRGGYKLEGVMECSPGRMSMINHLVAENLDATRSYSGQSDKKLLTVREEALKRMPELAKYEQAWPVTDAVKMRLKYTSAKARQHAQRAVSPTSKSRAQRR
ncbi:hypothetical protein NUW54_g6159 [Trametes sanguinea]|uniref:Uncharacterized protein n=1 Tax=Trametes sanguinea TaxID=158606 RepID=A0ACC1PW13_9APHY|nr:hypothetical protein NUW54_g6159 [Trametes sanguinea]